MRGCHRAKIRIPLISLIVLFFMVGCEQDGPRQKQAHAEKTIRTAALSEHGRYALVASIGSPAVLWDTQRHKQLFQWRHRADTDHAIIVTAITPDGRYAMTGEPTTLVRWDVEIGKSRGYWQMPAKIKDLALSPDGQYGLVALANQQAHYMDFENNQVLAKLKHDGPINSVAISPDGRYAVTGSDDRTVKLWLLENKQLLQIWRHEKPVTYVTFAADNRTVMSNSAQGGIFLWSTTSKKPLRHLETTPTSITVAEFSPNGQLLVAASPPRILSLWHVNSGQKIKEWLLPKTDFWKPTSVIVHDISFLPGNKSIMTEDSTGLGQVWDIH